MKEDEKEIVVLGGVQYIFYLSPNLSPPRKEALI
jgi:hypothetical protein